MAVCNKTIPIIFGLIVAMACNLIVLATFFNMFKYGKWCWYENNLYIRISEMVVCVFSVIVCMILVKKYLDET